MTAGRRAASGSVHRRMVLRRNHREEAATAHPFPKERQQVRWKERGVIVKGAILLAVKIKYDTYVQ